MMLADIVFNRFQMVGHVMVSINSIERYRSTKVELYLFWLKSQELRVNVGYGQQQGPYDEQQFTMHAFHGSPITHRVSRGAACVQITAN